MTDTPWLTLIEGAERARCGRTTVETALRAQELRGYQTGKSGRWRIHIDDLDAWVRGEVADVQIPVSTRRRAS